MVRQHARPTRALPRRPCRAVLALAAIGVVVAVTVAAVVGLARGGGDASSSGAGTTAQPVVTTVPSVAVSSSAPTPTADPFAPRFPIVTGTGAYIDGRTAPVYVPRAESARRAPEEYPLVVLEGARGVHPSQYDQLAHDLGGYGLTVVVVEPDDGPTVGRVRAWARRLASHPDEYLSGLVDPSRVLVVVHGDGDALDAARLRGAVVLAARTTSVSEAAGRTIVRLDDPLADTDDGRRGRRGVEPVDARRSAAIHTLAEPIAWWLLARVGDTTGLQYARGGSDRTASSAAD